MNTVYKNMEERINRAHDNFKVMRTGVTFKKSFEELRAQAFRLADAADPEWKSPRAMRILAIYIALGKKYMH